MVWSRFEIGLVQISDHYLRAEHLALCLSQKISRHDVFCNFAKVKPVLETDKFVTLHLKYRFAVRLTRCNYYWSGLLETASSWTTRSKSLPAPFQKSNIPTLIRNLWRTNSEKHFRLDALLAGIQISGWLNELAHSTGALQSCHSSWNSNLHKLKFWLHS